MEIERYLWHARRILATIAKRCVEMLSEVSIRAHTPTGAFYLFLDFSPLRDRLTERGIRDGTTLCDSLVREAGVAMLPGVAFERPAAELTARLAYVNFNGARALAASEGFALDQQLPVDFAERWCSRTLGGVQEIVNWARSLQG